MSELLCDPNSRTVRDRAFERYLEPVRPLPESVDPAPDETFSVVVPQRLSHSLAGPPVAVITAPAGFGKTTVIRSWMRDSTRATAVITFDEFERRGNAMDAGLRVLRGIEELGVEPATVRELSALLRADGSSLGEVLLRALRQELRLIPEEFLLVIEDIHRLGPATAEEIGWLVRQVASDARRFAVTSRLEPDWPVRRWVLEGFARTLNADDLRMRDDEIASFLGTRHASHWRDVVEMSSGWPAAVQVARWKLTSAHDAPLRSAVSDLAEFVRAEIVPSLPEESVHVLTRLSLLDSFPVSVAKAVTGHPATARVLQDTVRRTALVAMADDGRYRMHATMREAFRQLLVSREPEEIPALQRRAGHAWLEQPQTIDTLISALAHLSAAEAWEEATEVLRSSWPVLESQSRMDLVADGLDSIPERYWLDDPDLMPLAVSANLRLGRTARAGQLRRLAPRHGGARARLSVSLASALTVGWTADPIRTEQFCLRAATELANLDRSAGGGDLVFPGVTSYALAGELSLAQAVAMQGRFAEAVARYRGILDRSDDIARSVMISVHGGLAWSLALLGEVAESLVNSELGLSLAAELGRSTHVRTIPALLARAIAVFLHGDSSAARPALDQVVRLGRAAGAQNLLDLAEMVGVICGLGPLSQARSAGRPTVSVLPLAAQFIDARSLSDDAVRGRTAAARMRMSRTEPHELALAEWIEAILALEGRSAAGQWLARRDEPTSELARVVRLLCEATVTAQASRASRVAQEAAELADSLGMPGALAIAPRSLWQRRDVSRSPHPLLAQAASQTRPGSDLTGRELELLRLMATDMTIPEMAERLFVSIPTLKWHRANLYRKLGATSRREALATAVDTGLLSGRAIPLSPRHLPVDPPT